METNIAITKTRKTWIIKNVKSDKKHAEAVRKIKQWEEESKNVSHIISRVFPAGYTDDQLKNIIYQECSIEELVEQLPRDQLFELVQEQGERTSTNSQLKQLSLEYEPEDIIKVLTRQQLESLATYAYDK